MHFGFLGSMVGAVGVPAVWGISIGSGIVVGIVGHLIYDLVAFWRGWTTASLYARVSRSELPPLLGTVSVKDFLDSEGRQSAYAWAKPSRGKSVTGGRGLSGISLALNQLDALNPDVQTEILTQEAQTPRLLDYLRDSLARGPPELEVFRNRLEVFRKQWSRAGKSEPRRATVLRSALQFVREAAVKVQALSELADVSDVRLNSQLILEMDPDDFKILARILRCDRDEQDELIKRFPDRVQVAVEDTDDEALREKEGRTVYLKLAKPVTLNGRTLTWLRMKGVRPVMEGGKVLAYSGRGTVPRPVEVEKGGRGIRAIAPRAVGRGSQTEEDADKEASAMETALENGISTDFLAGKGVLRNVTFEGRVEHLIFKML
jgi:hypothetical protein